MLLQTSWTQLNLGCGIRCIKDLEMKTIRSFVLVFTVANLIGTLTSEYNNKNQV